MYYMERYIDCTHSLSISVGSQKILKLIWGGISPQDLVSVGESAELPHGLLMLDSIVMNSLHVSDQALRCTLGFSLLQSC